MNDLSYRSPKTEVRESPIHGKGLFAKQAIAAGEIVAVKGGHILSKQEWTPLGQQLGSAEIQIAEDLFIAPVREEHRDNSMLYTNHSCDPNIAIQGQIVFVAMRDITPGEELTHDWATTDDLDYVMECRCGSPHCRGVITGKDWMKPELQKKYKGWFCWFLQRKIDAALSKVPTEEKLIVQAPEIFATERLILRRPALTDAAEIFAYANDPEVTRYMVWLMHTNIEESVAFLEACGLRWEAGEEYCWAITVKPEDRAVGMIGCRVREYVADFGYVLHRAFWGQGYATEAARAVVTWLQSLPGICRIWATCDAENHASVRVLEKSGLFREGRLRRSTIRPNLSPLPRDTFVFALVRDEG